MARKRTPAQEQPPAQALSLSAYAAQLKDPGLMTYDELVEEIFNKGKLNVFKRTLQERHNRNMINLVVLGTGGTFQSAQTDHGIAPTGSLEQSFEAMRLPYNQEEINLNLFEIFNYDSATLKTGDHIRLMADVLIDLLRDCTDLIDGFIITHGTDTMVESVAYLPLILGSGLKRPVIITGSQEPARKRNTDASTNMNNCLKVFQFLQQQRISIGEVMVLCGKQLVRAPWAVKISDKNSNAFQSYNDRPLMDVGNELMKEWKLAEFVRLARADMPFLPFNGVDVSADIPVTKLADISEEKVGEVLEANRMSIWRLLGSSTCPNTHAQLIKYASEHGKAVVLQSPFHDAILTTGVYAAGAPLKDANIPQLKGTEEFIRAKFSWVWHWLRAKSEQREGFGEVIVDPRTHAQIYQMMSMNLIGEFD